MKFGKYIFIKEQMISELKHENQKLQIEISLLKAIVNNLKRDKRILEQLLDIEQQNTRMRK